MKMLWVFATLACFSFFFNAAKSDSGCNCDDKLTTVCVPIGGYVLVPCPNVTSTIMTFNLLWNGNITYAKRFSRQDPAQQQGGDVEVQLINGNGTFDLRLGKVNGSSRGIYRCDVEVILPPPRHPLTGSQRILLLVEEHQCIARKEGEGGTAEKAEEAEEGHCLWIWIPIVTIVALYGLIVTAVLIVSCTRLRTLACDNEYMNTKPPTPRAHWWKA